METEEALRGKRVRGRGARLIRVREDPWGRRRWAGREDREAEGTDWTGARRGNCPPRIFSQRPPLSPVARPSPVYGSCLIAVAVPTRAQGGADAVAVARAGGARWMFTRAEPWLGRCAAVRGDGIHGATGQDGACSHGAAGTSARQRKTRGGGRTRRTDGDVIAKNEQAERGQDGIGREAAWTDWVGTRLARQKDGSRIGVYASNETLLPNRGGVRSDLGARVETWHGRLRWRLRCGLVGK